MLTRRLSNLNSVKFRFRLDNWFVFLVKTQNFIFKSAIFYLHNVTFVTFIIQKPTLILINWSSVERHVYKLQRIILLRSASGKTFISLQNVFLESLASRLIVIRSLLWSKISLVKTLDPYQKFNLAVSFDTLSLSISSIFLKYSFRDYLKQQLICLILKPWWEEKLDKFNISSGLFAFRSYLNLKLLLESSPKYILRLNLKDILQFINPNILLSFFPFSCPKISRVILKSLDFASASGKDFFSACDSQEHSIFSLLTDVIAYHIVENALVQIKQLFFDIFSTLKIISSKGVIIFASRKLLVMQKLEVSIRCWLNYVLQSDWHKFIGFSHHCYSTKKHVSKLLRFEFSGLLVNAYYYRVNAIKRLVFCIKPSAMAIFTALYKIKRILYRFNHTMAVIFHIRRILVDLFSYYSSCSLNATLYSRLVFQIRYKLLCWSLRRHSHLRGYTARKQQVQFIIAQLKFSKFK